VSTHPSQHMPAPSDSGSMRSKRPPELRTAATLARMRASVRIDGIFETVLGAVLATSPATGLFTAMHLPNPATKAVVVIFGLLLLPLLPILWMASRNPQRGFVLTIAAANGMSALVLALWTIVWSGAFHPAGATCVLGVAGVLAILAALQARAALTAE
jgi:hypothetical protein